MLDIFGPSQPALAFALVFPFAFALTIFFSNRFARAAAAFDLAYIAYCLAFAFDLLAFPFAFSSGGLCTDNGFVLIVPIYEQYLP